MNEITVMSERTSPARRPRISPTIRPKTGSPARATQFELALPRRSAAVAAAFDAGVGSRVVAALDALPASRSSAGFAWQELREGVREVFLTLTATIALGLGWAALEAGWADAGPTPSGDAVDVATGYASLGPAPR